LVKELTAAAVAKYRPGPKRRRIRDALTKSLFLVIEPTGTKSWQMRFRTPSGRIGKLTLGRVDFSGRELKDDPQIGQPLTLAAARQLAAKVHRERGLGHDPIADHQARKHRNRAEIEERNASTFGAAVRAYVEEHARPKIRRWPETARMLGLRYPRGSGAPELIKGGLADRWADRPVRDIDSHDIWSVTDEARRVAVPGLAARNPEASDARARALFGALSGLFSWLKRRRRIEINPCANLDHPSGPEARERTLSDDEIRWFWRACGEVGEPFGTIFRLLLLTGARLNEVAGMRRDELSADAAMWQLPGHRTKNKRPHKVPLPSGAQAIIAAATGGQQIIFSTTGSTPPSGWSRAKRRLDAAMLAFARAERGPDVTIPGFRLHDLRRTAVTGMAELGIRPDVIELVVNHVSGHRGGIAGVYNRSELMAERKNALERWSAHVEGLATGQANNVVDMHLRQQGAA
jgi:integrase